MNKRVSLLLVSFLLCTGAVAAPPTSDFASLPPVQQEARAASVLEAKPTAGEDRFALGGMGLAGAKSDKFVAYEAILRRKDASAIFQKLLNSSFPIVQLYALTGLSQCAPDVFRAVAFRFTNRQDKILTVRGCVIASQPMGEMVENLLAGRSPLSSVPKRSLPSDTGK